MHTHAHTRAHARTHTPEELTDKPAKVGPCALVAYDYVVVYDYPSIDRSFLCIAAVSHTHLRTNALVHARTYIDARSPMPSPPKVNKAANPRKTCTQSRVHVRDNPQICSAMHLYMYVCIYACMYVCIYNAVGLTWCQDLFSCSSIPKPCFFERQQSSICRIEEA